MVSVTDVLPCHERSETESVISQRLTELLMQFPSSAIDGVQWRVLAKRYEQRFYGPLDIKSLGHPSAFSAATTLLQNVARVDGSADNPILSLVDTVALSPRSGCIGSWPSLYVALCAAVQLSGTNEEAQPGVRSLLLSRVKPLLQQQWHAHFDETTLLCVNEQGGTLKLKKMKHLIVALLRWRDQRRALLVKEGRAPSLVDEALARNLEVNFANSQKDMTLVCDFHEDESTVCGVSSAQEEDSGELLSEVDFKEPAGNIMESTAEVSCLSESPMSDEGLLSGRMIPPSFHEVFDDPFEPPPQKGWTAVCFSQKSFWSDPASFSSLDAFEIDCDSTHSTMTPISHADEPCVSHTDVHMKSMWIPFRPGTFGDRGEIPNGIVERVRSKFESSGEDFPHTERMSGDSGDASCDI
mmetsp:Transcript_52700/g.140559  ORF Transcript_52700/g.140559 Transcript_52700/m.140559 type:complete len:411 (-) Transcript_52700:357-1589(-)